ncbi:MAG: T9SS type A sorting domain-containing protein [Flavobacteriales bacterium]|nr:T9SS type A sorting domain-containing protein [Flavobacteriales bacterium]
MTCASLQAQPTFEKLWLCVGSYPLAMTELASGNVLLNYQWSRGASVFDPNGNLVQSSHYWNAQLGGPLAIRQRSANEFYFATWFITPDSCYAFFNQQYPAIGRMDSLGRVQEVHYYVMSTQGCENYPRDLEVTNDGGVILWGRDKNFFALRTDENGTPTWAKYFGYNIGFQIYGHSGSFEFIRELPGGDLLAGINMDTAGVVVARMDAGGNFLWCKSYIRPGGMVHDCLIESDDSFIITGATDTIASTNSLIPLPPDYHPKLFMMKLDGGGDVQWCKGYDSAPNFWYSRDASRIVRAQDGNFMVLADLGVQGYNLEYRPFLMKTDVNGDTLWTRSMGRNGYRYDTADLLPYSDGGFIYNGGMVGDVGAWSGAGYIFKTDSLGHLPCYERRHPITITDLFPMDSSFTLTSTDGATMYEVPVTDTSYAPIVVYDGCTFTTGLNDMQVRKGQHMQVRPNPNTGHFTIAFQDPLMAETYYSVYDALGKLLYQRPLAPGKTTEEVDLSRFGAGTYVIRCTDPGGVSYERVVVE